MKQKKSLEEKILRHKALYYQGRPEISDSEFDALEEALRAIDPGSNVLQVVGATPGPGKKVAHHHKMLSLNKVYDLVELSKWRDGHELISTYKIDGVSCSLIYEEGKFILAKTRGDGSFGEDITAKAKWIANIPTNLFMTTIKAEVRGEIYCSEENFYELAKEMAELGLEKPTSQRNIVAGLIGRKDHISLARYLNFQAFEIITDDLRFSKEIEKFQFLKKSEFEIPDAQLHKTDKTIAATIESAREFMASGDYQIDGLVFTYNDINKHHELGETSHHPRYKMAFKYRGESKNTTVDGFEWGVSRNGILTPVALVAPVELSGAEIRRVTLHNFGVVEQNNIKIGDEIEIIRSGEVIPKFLSVVKSTGGNFTYPKTCPSCHQKTSIETIRLLCTNEQCPAQVKEGILNYIKAVGIDDLSTKRLEEMMRVGLVKSIPDLYDLSIDHLLTLDKTKEKLAQKIYREIQKSKETTLVKFLAALGLQGGAFNKCEKIVHAGYDSLAKIKKLTQIQLEEIDGFAQKSAEDLHRSLQSKIEVIKQLESKGFKFESVVVEDNPIKGKKICITGSLSQKRSVIEEKIRSLGGVVTSSVGKTTDYLLTNDQTPSSSKYKKAIDLNINVISEEEFFTLAN
tara:strand:- start:24295 stop:26178 length:1884 start_codon:yes stop_codon:yes gene_type:complete